MGVFVGMLVVRAFVCVRGFGGGGFGIVFDGIDRTQGHCLPGAMAPFISTCGHRSPNARHRGPRGWGNHLSHGKRV